VDLARGEEVLEHLQPREQARLEQLLREADALEDGPELLGAAAGVPLAGEAGQRGGDLVEAHAVAAVVRAAVAERELAAGEDVGDDLGDLTDLVVVAGVADVEDLGVDGLAGR